MIVGLLVVAAGCGAARIAPPIAEDLATQADEIATLISDGDGCTAVKRIAVLRTDAADAIASGAVPPELADPLEARIVPLERVRCIPPKPSPTPSPTAVVTEHESDGNGKGKGRGKGKDDGEDGD